MNISDQIKQKYGYCFWDVFLSSEEQLKEYIGDNYSECNRWPEFGVTLIEIASSHDMHSEIVVLK